MEVRAEYQALHDRLDELAANEYMAGPGSSLEVILGASSFADLIDRTQFVSSVSSESMDLATQLTNVAAQLAQRTKHLNNLLAAQKTLIAQLAQQQDAKASAVAAEASALAQLDQTRTSIVALVGRLQKQLRAEEIAGIGRIFQGRAHVSYGTWSGYFLRTMGVSGMPLEHGGARVLAGRRVHAGGVEPARDHVSDAGLDAVQRVGCPQLRLAGSGPGRHAPHHPRRNVVPRLRADRLLAGRAAPTR